MFRIHHTLIIGMLSTAAFNQPALAQAPTLLQIDIDNIVEYQTDTMDMTLFSTKPTITPSAQIGHFQPAIVIGDIVAVNGEPVTGTFVGRPWDLSLRSVVTPGQAIGDTARLSVGFRTFEILKTDGTPIGTLMALGLNGGTSPPGANFGGQNFAIVGGTGAFLGARGQQGGRQIPGFSIPLRAASITEDPAYRRMNGGGRVRWLLAVVPSDPPQVVMHNDKALRTHGNSSDMKHGNRSVEEGVWSLYATGLGPTVPGVDVGEPFPSAPVAVVNSPLTVTVDGIAAEVISAFGVPGSIDTYEIQVRVPPGTDRGQASVQITAAWVRGPAVTIPIR